MNKRAGLLLTVALVVTMGAVVSGCNAGQGATPTGPDLALKVRETMRDAKTAEGSFELSVTLNKEGLKSLLGDAMSMTGSMIPKGGTGMAYTEMIDMLPDMASARLKVWAESPDKGRMEVESSTLPGASGVTIVSDGQKVYGYSPANSTVYTASRDALEKMREQMKDRHDESGMGGMMAGFDDPEVAFNKMLDATDLRVVGTEKIGERDAYRLEGTPKPDAAARLGLPVMAQGYIDMLAKGAKGTVWVDKERSIPLKATFEHPDVGSFTYSGEWKLNEPVDPALFVLQVPPGTETVDVDEHLEMMGDMQSQMPETVTLAQARELALKDGWKLLEPSYLPAGATLVEVRKMPGIGTLHNNPPSSVVTRQGDGFALSYSSPNSDFQIHQMTLVAGFDWPPYLPANGDDHTNAAPMKETESKQVKVRGVDAQLSTLSGPTANLVWLSWVDKGNIHVAINGNLTEDEILKIAEALQ